MTSVKRKPKSQEWPGGEEEDYVRRAIAAFLRNAGPNELVPMPANTSSVQEHKGKFYVELHNVNGTLAVYRIRNDGVLKRMKRWPLEVENTLEAIHKLRQRGGK